MEPRKPSFWRRFGLGTAPAVDAEEMRAFLQRRVALYLGALALLWLAITVTATGSALIFAPELVTAPRSRLAGMVHNVGTLALIVCWFYARRGKRSLAVINWLDAGVTVGQAVVMSVIMDSVDFRFRPDMNMTMGMTAMLIGRAAVVPSSPSRTLLVGALASLPVLSAAVRIHVAQAGPGALPPGVLVPQIANWIVFALLLSTTISRVIYGLYAKVQEAARLGQYTLEQKIGQGGMGVVYRARHALLRRPTAIKLLAPGSTGQPALDRFEREVQATSRLRHPNTIAIYDYGRTPDGVFYYAMEYLDGVDLERLVQHVGPLPEGRVLHILSQAAGALAEAHAQGLIHRDIKPSNILLCDHGLQADFVKVLDFGLVKDTAPDAAASIVQSITGTPLYMSPESVTSPSTIDARSDLYALGAVAYFLLTGVPPFQGKTPVEVWSHHLHSQVVPPSQRREGPLSPALEALVLSCMAKDPASRPASTAALAERLSALQQSSPWPATTARAWWDQHGPVIRAARLTPPSGSAGRDTVAVDLARRVS